MGASVYLAQWCRYTSCEEAGLSLDSPDLLDTPPHLLSMSQAVWDERGRPAAPGVRRVMKMSDLFLANLHCGFHTLTYLLTVWLTHPLSDHSLTNSLTQSLTNWLTDSLTDPFTHWATDTLHHSPSLTNRKRFPQNVMVCFLKTSRYVSPSVCVDTVVYISITKEYNVLHLPGNAVSCDEIMNIKQQAMTHYISALSSKGAGLHVKVLSATYTVIHFLFSELLLISDSAPSVSKYTPVVLAVLGHF